MRHALQWGATVFLILSALPPRAPAQSGVVSGRVVADDQAPLRAVEIQLINLASAEVRRLRTGSDGEFQFAGVAAGRYSLAAMHDRYTAWRSAPFEVLPGVPVSVPAVVLRPLRPTLTSPRSGLEEMSVEYGLVREQIEALPVLIGSEGRTTVDKLLHLVPGLTPAAALEVDPFTGRAAAVSANGSRRSFINYQLNGASNNAQNRVTGAQAANYGPVPEAIESLRVTTHTYSARDGRNAGAVVAPMFRSGSDAWHGQARGYVRPPWNRSLGSFDGATDAVEGWVGGFQASGPLWPAKRLFVLLDGEAWFSDRQHQPLRRVLSDNERVGDFLAIENRPIDPLNGMEFPNGVIPANRLDPLMQRYLDTFVPRANLLGGWVHFNEALASHGQAALGRIDRRSDKLAHSLSYYAYANRVREPPAEAFTTSPGTITTRRQVSHHLQYALTHTASPSLTQTLGFALQRLSSGQWQGHRRLGNQSAEEFGFDYSGVNPGTIPNVRLWHDTGTLQLHVSPFIGSENSVQSTWQLRHDAEFRRSGHAIRGGLLLQLGLWPFTLTENQAGTFRFPGPPEPPLEFEGQGLPNLLLGRPNGFRLQTPRSLDLRWEEVAAYVESEIRPRPDLKITLGMRFEQQPPARDTLDRLVAFREGAQSARFPNALPSLLFPGDRDPSRNILPRSTILSSGRNFAPRIGLAYSPAWDGRGSRWILGESGRSVFRAAYGVFYDHGTFAGSSAAALFQATYPPFSTDNRFSLPEPTGAFAAPIAALPILPPASSVTQPVRHPIRVFDPDFQNARAQHWNLSWQRLLPGRVFLSGSYLGTRSRRLQAQRELNFFVRDPQRGFASVRDMRRYTRFGNIRSFESSGGARFQAVQVRANRYLHRGLALDVSYGWSRSFDNGSTVLGEELVGEEWTFSNFDRRHSLTALWQYRVRLPRRWTDRARWADRWSVSGIWRFRSGLPLDIRQSQDPTFSFEQVGRPDRVAAFTALDPDTVRTFRLPSGRLVTGRFAFDPSAFRQLRPLAFNQTRQGNSRRNEYRLAGFQQWDLRFSRTIDATEDLSMEISFDVLNAFGNRNWAEPFGNVDHVYFGIARMAGLGRTIQSSLRLSF